TEHAGLGAAVAAIVAAARRGRDVAVVVGVGGARAGRVAAGAALIAVLIDAVAAHLGRAGVDGRIGVVAVELVGRRADRRALAADEAVAVEVAARRLARGRRERRLVAALGRQERVVRARRVEQRRLG